MSGSGHHPTHQFGPAVQATLAVIQRAGPAGITREDLALTRGVTTRAVYDATRSLLRFGAIVSENLPNSRRIRYRATEHVSRAALTPGATGGATAILAALLRARTELDAAIAEIQRLRE